MNIPWQPSNPTKLAIQFSRLGWVGLWGSCLAIVFSLQLFKVTWPSSDNAATEILTEESE